LYDKILEEFERLLPREDQSPDQRRFYAQISGTLMTRHLEHLIENRDWFSGIIMSASMLEFTGKTRLLWKEIRVSKEKSGKIYKLNFASTIKQLLKHKIINKQTYERLEKIRLARNEAAHDIPQQVALSLERKPNSIQERNIEDAIKIIDVLFQV